MSLLLFKLVVTPLTIAAITLAARRWGAGIGGLLTGLPLISGPISIFVAIEQGPKFAAHAAAGGLLGWVSFLSFCLVYARMALNHGPWLSTFCGLAAFFTSAGVFSLIPASLGWALPLSLAWLLFAAFAIGAPRGEPVSRPIPWWDLPLRMACSALLVASITTAANWMGPQATGLLSPFPVIIGVMTIFTHNQAGGRAAHRLLHGSIFGGLGSLAFFTVVNLIIEHLSLTPAYLFAFLAAMLANALGLIVLMKVTRPKACISSR